MKFMNPFKGVANKREDARLRDKLARLTTIWYNAQDEGKEVVGTYKRMDNLYLTKLMSYLLVDDTAIPKVTVGEELGASDPLIAIEPRTTKTDYMYMMTNELVALFRRKVNHYDCNIILNESAIPDDDMLSKVVYTNLQSQLGELSDDNATFLKDVKVFNKGIKWKNLDMIDVLKTTDYWHQFTVMLDTLTSKAGVAIIDSELAGDKEPELLETFIIGMLDCLNAYWEVNAPYVKSQYLKQRSDYLRDHYAYDDLVNGIKEDFNLGKHV